MALRDFLFLNTQTVNSYLSTLEGYVIEEPTEEKETGSREAGGGFNLGATYANGKLGTSVETTRKLIVTDEARFDHLHSLLDKRGELQFLDAFDVEIWEQFNRGEILEVQADIRLPQPFLLTQDIDNFSGFLDIMEAVGQNPFKDEQSQTAFKGMQHIASKTADTPVPLIFEAFSTRGLSFTTSLPRQYIQRSLNELQGEATVFGKIQRIIPQKETYEVFSLAPAITGASTLNRQQRRKMQKDAAKRNVSEMIKGPAIVLTPIAVYR
jgi:hypothetical protein